MDVIEGSERGESGERGKTGGGSAPNTTERSRITVVEAVQAIASIKAPRELGRPSGLELATRHTVDDARVWRHPP